MQACLPKGEMKKPRLAKRGKVLSKANAQRIIANNPDGVTLQPPLNKRGLFHVSHCCRGSNKKIFLKSEQELFGIVSYCSQKTAQKTALFHKKRLP
jgi:hypothetical protein